MVQLRPAVSPQPIGILVADSDFMHCKLLVGALRRRPEFHVTSCALDIDAMADAIAQGAIDVALIKTNDDNVLRNFHLAHPQVAKVLLLQESDPDPVVNAFRSGARGVFRLADSSFRLLCKCVHRVHQGEIWVSNQQLAYLLEAFTLTPGLRVVNSEGMKLLTAREEEVVALVAEGMSNRDIALELGLSENTIKKYLFRIFDKVGVSSRVELVLYAVSHGVSRASGRESE